MATRLSPSQVQAVRDLLSLHCTRQQVAMATGVSESTIRLIELDVYRADGRYQRCPTCGGLVILPCRLCGLKGREMGVMRAIGPMTPIAPMETGPSLTPEHQANYEAVRAEHERVILELRERMAETYRVPRDHVPAEVLGDKRRRFGRSFQPL